MRILPLVLLLSTPAVRFVFDTRIQDLQSLHHQYEYRTPEYSSGMVVVGRISIRFFGLGQEVSSEDSQSRTTLRSRSTGTYYSYLRV